MQDSGGARVSEVDSSAGPKSRAFKARAGSRASAVARPQAGRPPQRPPSRARRHPPPTILPLDLARVWAGLARHYQSDPTSLSWPRAWPALSKASPRALPNKPAEQSRAAAPAAQHRPALVLCQPTRQSLQASSPPRLANLSSCPLRALARNTRRASCGSQRPAAAAAAGSCAAAEQQRRISSSAAAEEQGGRAAAAAAAVPTRSAEGAALERDARQRSPTRLDQGVR